MSTPARTCPACGKPLPTDAPQGLCPPCLAQSALGSQPGGDETLASGSKPGSSGPAAIQPEIARLFPQLEILELLGQGGMGVVYKARQPQLDRLVALKVMRADLSRDPAFAERFLREARALAKLSHPNIVAIHDFGQVGGVFYFIMEFVDGLNLRQMLQTGRITPVEALAIVPKLCDALQFAHDEGVTHRDIKPENILMDRKGRVKMADFGLAKLTGGDTTDFGITATGMTMGTPKYMAPEQIENAKTVDHRADIYSLGVVFYEMLTGELPLGRFAVPSQKVQIDVRLDEIVLKALEKEPARRYQQASEVRTQVEGVTSTAGVKPRIEPEAPDGEEPAALQPPASMTRSPLFWTVLLCALGALSTLLTWTTYDKVNGHQPGATFSRIVEGKASAYFTWHGVAVLFLFVASGLFALVTKLDRRYPFWSAAIAIATALGTAIVETLQVFSVNHALVALMATKHFGFEVSVISQPGVGVFLAYGASLGILISGFLQLRRFFADPVQLPRSIQPARRYQHVSEVKTDVENVTHHGAMVGTPSQPKRDGGTPTLHAPPAIPAAPDVPSALLQHGKSLLIVGIILLGSLFISVLVFVIRVNMRLIPLPSIGVAEFALQLVVLLHLVAGTLAIAAGVLMRRCRCRGLAVASAILCIAAFLPVLALVLVFLKGSGLWTLLFSSLVAIIFGFRVLAVLRRPEIIMAFAREKERRRALKANASRVELSSVQLRSKVRDAGLLMTIAGIAVALSGLIAFIHGAAMAFHFANRVGNPGDAAARAAGGAFMMLTVTLCGIAALIGGVVMRKLRGHDYALAMSVLLMALLPVALLTMGGRMSQVEWIFFQHAFALYAGIKCFRLLRKPEVEAVFSAERGNLLPTPTQPFAGSTGHLVLNVLLSVFTLWFLLEFGFPVAQMITGPDTRLIEVGRQWRLGTTVDSIFSKLAAFAALLAVGNFFAWRSYRRALRQGGVL